MSKLIYLLLIASVSFCSKAVAVNIMGFEQPESLQTQSQSLQLNGYGIRSKWLMNIYIAGLYLKPEHLHASDDWVVYADSPMALRLVVMRNNLNSQRMIWATRESFEQSNGVQPLLQEQLQQLLQLYREDVNKGDIYTLSYTPDKGLQTFKNNQLINTIHSLSFKQAVFNMWFGKQPVQERLKQQLLNH